MSNSKTFSTFHDLSGRWTIHQGDVRQVLPALSASQYDATISDPPYGLSFMNHGWDREVPPASVWEALLKVCKPGAHLLAFGGTKTFHRQVCNIEDGGWEIRDTISWLYGQGFPKGHNISDGIRRELGKKRSVAFEKSNAHPNADRTPYFSPSDNATTSTVLPASDQAVSWTGYSTALKPAWEPVTLAQKLRNGTFAQNALRYGCGGLNINACRIGTSGGTKRSHQAPYQLKEDGTENRQSWARNGHSAVPINEGRWPANVLLNEHAAHEVNRQSGNSRSTRGKRRSAGSSIGNGKTLNSFRSSTDAFEGYDDKGGASRFFYVAKASGKERNDNNHPTVKPLNLCVHLARLILPPKRQTQRCLIVPFSGSGSEMLGALLAGWDHVTGIELDPEHVQTSRRRLSDFGKGHAMLA